MRILGLDPGLTHTGWGVIEAAADRLAFVAAGRITTRASDPLPHRLTLIAAGLRAVIADHRPDEAAVEETFVNANAASALKLGMARGVVLFVPADAGLPVGEYAASVVKKAVVGTGGAAKEQVQMMIGRLLPGSDAASADAADALAVAVCHAHHRAFAGVVASLSRARAAPSPPRDEGAKVAGGPNRCVEATPARPPHQQKPRSGQPATARRLHQEATDVERILWQRLCAGQLGTKFRRQEPVLGFVVDFVSHADRLIVELDGGLHDREAEADARRTRMLAQAGFAVMRISNGDVVDDLDGVLAAIAERLQVP